MNKQQLKRKIDSIKDDKDIRIFDPIGMSKYNFFCTQLKMLLSKTTYITAILIKHD